MTDARVRLWGRDIGAVSWIADRDIAAFQFAPEFVGSGIEVAPLTMPLANRVYEFPDLARETFKGLPGMLADSLPDKFGNALIDAWLARAGREPASFNPVERLCYIGTRGMGALEFEPAVPRDPSRQKRLEIDALVALANRVLDERVHLAGKLSGDDDAGVIDDILRVGTSAGGARAKAILAFNEKTGEFRSGQIPAAKGFSYWLMKFDGVAGNRDREVADPQGYGLIEFAYHRMAVAAGVEMSECRLHREGGRAHFMTRRFDRTADGDKLHMQSLGAMRHFDFNQPGAYSYEQALMTIRQLGLPMTTVEEQFRRAVFSVIARDHDDHVKNIAFLMNRRGEWRLSPAFDVAYAYNPDGLWTNRHQMSINGKRDGFTIEDLIALGEAGDIKRTRSLGIVDEVDAAVGRWLEFAADAGVAEKTAESIGRAHRRAASLRRIPA
ncbi:MAG: type II toxin-antitoxin system HipA family toxin [Gammaproteobacteria bacterium]|nr:type II toxin-antitoxin system HipA family toxin [Gammaproteobacteria bacterium]